ncbi:MAG: iron-sulfur cluster assembly scaffold protein [Sphingomicrobium sp.]
MNAPLYTTQILRLAASLDAPHALYREDGRAELRSPACGSRVETAVTLDADGRIAALSQDVNACAFGQASAALVAQSAVGADRHSVDRALAELDAWLGGERDNPGAWPGLTALTPALAKRGRHGAIMLPFRALSAALAEAGRG